MISEVADKGTSNACPGKQDWVELHNTGSSAVSLAGYKLHDDRGPDDSKAYVFPRDREIKAGAYLVLCTGVDDKSPMFKIGGSDTITLRNAAGAVVSRVGPLPGDGEFDFTWAYNSKTTVFAYTSTPTPGSANVFTSRPLTITTTAAPSTPITSTDRDLTMDTSTSPATTGQF